MTVAGDKLAYPISDGAAVRRRPPHLRDDRIDELARWSIRRDADPRWCYLGVDAADCQRHTKLIS
jgi:hypothetical protein